MLKRQLEVFATDDTDIGNVYHNKMTIRLKDNIPCEATYNSIPRRPYQKSKHYVKDLHNKQWVISSNLECSYSFVTVTEKDGTK